MGRRGMKQFIVITGEAESGKDTVAGSLAEYFTQSGKRVIITHYADLLKYTCESFFDWDGVKDTYGRSLLQKVGTELIREQLRDTYWIDYVWDMLYFSKDKWDVAIIADARYENEIDVEPKAKKIDKDAAFATIKITRPKKNSLSEEQRKHSSEANIDGVKTDYEIKNNGDLRRLREEAKVIATSMDNTEKRDLFPGDVIKYKETDTGEEKFAIVLQINKKPVEVKVVLLVDGYAQILTSGNSKDVTVIGSVSEELNEMLSMARWISGE